MIGLRFDECHTFLLSFQFYSCQLDYSSFYQLQIKDGVFQNCRLLEVDFTEADLSSANFTGSDFSGAVFSYTTLNGADFRGVRNLSLDPEINPLQNAHFSSDGIQGLLVKYGILIS
tara:strand:+ start:13000 stop:13347 length:348 start_codon:yes stop_codon:yes gene_type:complete